MGVDMLCPRRGELPGTFKFNDHDDEWRSDGTCSFCGSLNPENVLASIKAGVAVIPTDKSYKMYLDGYKKAYFQHFSKEQQIEFIGLYNAKTMKLGEPGYFYQRPYFMAPIHKGE